ncbi:MAG: protein-glutamate O-methyltransferase CheR [Acidothermus cellulolyticus]|nr:protein-glutamate O-methyltransferase CheR [Acidothermus cellulolyticus]
MTINGWAFTYVADLVKQMTAINLGPGKEYLVENRLAPLAREAGFRDVAALIGRVQASGDERLRRQIVEALTTNETSFFRDREPFTVLRQVVIPDLCRRRAGTRRITIWSAGCSSGQEPYSIAMTVIDHPLITSEWSVEILATDVSEEMLAKAKSGRYSQLEVNRGLPAPLLVRHFERCETDWRVVAPVRNLVRFQKLNLAEDFNLPFVDVVFLRNVLIYFDTPTKIDVLRRVREVLRPDGYLFLGGSETTLGLDDAFDRLVAGAGTFYRPRGAGMPDVAGDEPPVGGGAGPRFGTAAPMAARGSAVQASINPLGRR